MTISTSTRTAGPFIGNDVSTTFAFTFKVFGAGDLELVKTDTVLGTESTLAITTDYTVTLNDNQNAAPGGSVTLVNPLPVDNTLIITSSIDATQETDLTNQGGFYPQVITNALDKLTILIQQSGGLVGRALRFPISDTSYNATLPTKALRAGRVLAFDSTTGDPVQGPTIAEVGSVGAAVAAITAVSNDLDNVNTVSANIGDVNIVASGIGNVNSVGNDIANVNTVASNIGAVNTTATNIGAVIAAPTEASAAAASANAAAASAAAAAASSASGMFSAVQDKSASYTVALADAGDLIRMSSSSGPLTVTLPETSTLPDGFNVTIVKWTGDTNNITVARSGSGLINGSISHVLDAQFKSATFVSDLETDTWFASGAGTATANVIVDSFVANGTQTAFLLSGEPGTENNTLVNVGGQILLRSQYSLSGVAVNFNVAPAAGPIEIQWTQPLAIGIPSDNSISTVKLIDRSVTADKLSGGMTGFSKADAYSPVFVRTGSGTISIKAGSYVELASRWVNFVTQTAVTMPTLLAGVDYAIWCTPSGGVEATSNHTTPPVSGARKIGGFHYAPGGNATATSGGNTTPQINEYSIWDLKFKPACQDPRGMTLVAGGFWIDIYLTGVDAISNGSSRYNVTMADGASPPKIPTSFGGNGSTTYGGYTWFEAMELAMAFGKRCPTQQQFMAAAYGTTEQLSIGADQNNTVLNAQYTSKWGVMQSTGVLWVWGCERGGPFASAAWNANTEGRGSEYNAPNAVLLGGYWGETSNAGSRCSFWGFAASVSLNFIGSRFACDHLTLD